MSFSIPEFTSGALLSAYHLNTITEATNALKGAVVAPPAVFVKSGISQNYICRRKYRYLHVRYSVFCDPGENITVSISDNDYYYNADQSDVWQTYDLFTDINAPDVDEFYTIAVSKSGTGRYLIEEIRESSASTPTATSGTYTYTAPPSFSILDNAATLLTKLQQLRTSVLSMQEVVSSPSSAYLRAQDTYQYTMRRCQPQISLTYTSTSTIDLDVYVNPGAGNATVFSETNERTFYTRTVSYSGLTYVPAQGATFTLQWSRDAGSFIVDDINEAGYSLATYAPLWEHGDQILSVTALGQYSTVIADAYAALGVVGWQYPCIYRPYDNPKWAARKVKRFLHYMRDGANACRIVDPGGVYDAVSLSRTSSDTDKIVAYDLDSIDWLSDGGLFWIENADIVWMDDEA